MTYLLLKHWFVIFLKVFILFKIQISKMFSPNIMNKTLYFLCKSSCVIHEKQQYNFFQQKIMHLFLWVCQKIMPKFSAWYPSQVQSVQVDEVTKIEVKNIFTSFMIFYQVAYLLDEYVSSMQLIHRIEFKIFSKIFNPNLKMAIFLCIQIHLSISARFFYQKIKWKAF